MKLPEGPQSAEKTPSLLGSIGDSVKRWREAISQLFTPEKQSLRKRQSSHLTGEMMDVEYGSPVAGQPSTIVRMDRGTYSKSVDLPASQIEETERR